MQQSHQPVWVGIDVGGTFTDLVSLDPASGMLRVEKVPSTPPDFATGVLTGLHSLVADWGRLELFLHGTTVHLNAFLERKGVPAALITTAGFGDVYAMRRGNRTRPYDLHFRYPEPLIPRRRIHEISARMTATGAVLRSVDTDELRRVLAQVRAEGVRSVAVCLLHSYADPRHEEEVCAFLQSEAPDLFVTASHRVSQEWREYERTSTVCINAYVSPILRDYLANLARRLADEGFRRRIYVMRSNGGLASAEESGETAVLSLMSGPVGGNVASRVLGRQTGRPNLICIDMGGTSFETSLVVGGESAVVMGREVSGFEVQAPIVDIHTIGAGGGSIAWNDGGLLRVGPQSAGSAPGPACYGHGGTAATVTDANLVLGRLNADTPFAGNIRLDPARAHAAVAAVAGQFGLDVVRAAEGIVAIVNENMANAIRTMTINRGIDPRDFALVAFGGAGPMHAVDIARTLGIGTVLVPTAAGAFCAWGMLQTDVRHDLAANFLRPLPGLDRAQAEQRFRELERQLEERVRAEGVDATAITFSRAMDLRYLGQEYTLTLPLPQRSMEALTAAGIKDLFDAMYERTYGHQNPDEEAEVVNLRVFASGPLHRGRELQAHVPATAAGATVTRPVVFGGASHATTFLSRAALAQGRIVPGPVVIEEQSCTTVVPPGSTVRLDGHGNLVIATAEAA